MKPQKHIGKLFDCLYKLNINGHIDTPDKYAAIKDVEIAIHKLQKAFEQEITDKRGNDT